MYTRVQVKTTSLKFIISILFLIFSIVAQAQVADGVVVDKIIAKVDNYIVLKSDLEKAYLNYLSSGNPASPTTKCQIFAQLVSGKLMVAKAEIDSVIVSDPEVDNNLDRRMNLILSQYGGSQDQLEQYYGKTLEQIKLDIRDEIKEQLTVQRMQETITQDVKVTPSDVRKFFNSIPQDSLPYFSTEVEVAQLVKYPKISQSRKNALIRQLNELRNRALAGESFEALAKEYSQGPSAKFGGNLGNTTRGSMAPEYEANALKLKAGEISMPFETSFGIHITQLIERRGNEYNSRHIILIPKPSEEDIKTAENYLDSLKTLIQQDSMSFREAAKEYSDDQFSAGNGGYFQDDLGANSVSVDELDPVIFFAIDTMSVGSISEPMRFQTQDGKDAVRILYYKSKKSPHQANLKEDWQKIYTATLNQKRSTTLNSWFNKAREDVFISIDDEYDFCGILN